MIIKYFEIMYIILNFCFYKILHVCWFSYKLDEIDIQKRIFRYHSTKNQFVYKIFQNISIFFISKNSYRRVFKLSLKIDILLCGHPGSPLRLIFSLRGFILVGGWGTPQQQKGTRVSNQEEPHKYQAQKINTIIYYPPCYI